jgi:hypothetical protein
MASLGSQLTALEPQTMTVRDSAAIGTSPVEVEAESDEPRAQEPRAPSEEPQAQSKAQAVPPMPTGGPNPIVVEAPKPGLANIDAPVVLEVRRPPQPRRADVPPPAALLPSTAARPPKARSPVSTERGLPAPTDPVGPERLGSGVRRLGYAFTRTIAAAALADPEWQELSVGPVGTIGIELSIDEGKHLGLARQFRAQSGEEAEPPAALQRLVDRTLLMLQGEALALSTSNQPGVERLVVEVVVRSETADSAPGAVLQQAFSGATPRIPGKAYVHYGTGRTIEATVTILRAGAPLNESGLRAARHSQTR